MQTVLATILAAAAAYLLGSVSFAVVVSKGLPVITPLASMVKGRSPDAGG